MNALKDVHLTGTTNGSGALTVTAPYAVVGYLAAVEWVDGTLDNNNTATLSVTKTPSGVDLTILSVGAGEGDNDKWYFPRVLEHDNGCGNLATYTRQVVAGTLQLVVASGGATKTGGCVVWIADE